MEYNLRYCFFSEANPAIRSNLSLRGTKQSFETDCFVPRNDRISTTIGANLIVIGHLLKPILVLFIL